MNLTAVASILCKDDLVVRGTAIQYGRELLRWFLLWYAHPLDAKKMSLHAHVIKLLPKAS